MDLQKYHTDRIYKFNLRGWLLYRLTKILAPDLSTKEALERAIAKDRAGGPKYPPKRMLTRYTFTDSVLGGIRTFRAKNRTDPDLTLCLFYLHGGAYVLDFQAIQWNLVDGLLTRVPGQVVAPIYPLGPEAGWRETKQAIRSAYLAAVAEFGAENIIACGDSAGGGLALLLAQMMRDEGGPAPKALVLISPCLDISGSGQDQPAIELRDPALSLSLLENLKPMWADDIPANDPRISPLFADHDGLPPTIVFSGDRDILDSDALRLKSRNPDIDLRRYAEMQHVFPVSPLREARHALDEAALFIRRHH